MQDARRLVDLTIGDSDDFYCPIHSLSKHSNPADALWGQTVGKVCSITGCADYVTGRHLFGALDNVLVLKALDHHMRGFQRDVLPRFLRRITAAPVPVAIHEFLERVKSFDWSFDIKTRRVRSIETKTVTETGLCVNVEAEAGQLWTALDKGKLKVTVLPLAQP